MQEKTITKEDLKEVSTEELFNLVRKIAKEIEKRYDEIKEDKNQT